ncbi:MAG TPA: hypothetical protein VHQ43_08215 [Solirubrobacterales bacterium]|jgi:hypothetical protein|nr:hypothetical protein [Solirubrobacterales bacterium]
MRLRRLTDSGRAEDPTGTSQNDFAELSRPPIRVHTSVDSGIVIPEKAWHRLLGRIRRMPEPSTGWRTLASLLAGLALSMRSLELSIVAMLGAAICELAYRSVNAAHGHQREDILEELELHHRSGVPAPKDGVPATWQ